ncbi:MAG: L-seryl-tRNA(Sec) selenium transferase [Pseudomonadota bacterium]
MGNEFRKLPGVDRVLEYPEIKALSEEYGRELVTYAVRSSINVARVEIQSEKQASTDDQLVSKVKELVESIAGKSLKPVINATGVVLHTNLGRAPIGRKAVEDAVEILTGYSNLEFDLENGKRGSRSIHVTELIKYLTGAEDAIVVNNNAAGIILALNTLTRGKEIIISRGELIEIGGSFRIPEIMRAAGVKMVEVGATNKTRIKDFEDAITPKTGMIFKAHTSNYTIQGFTEDVDVNDLSKLAHSNNLLLLYDIGSGLLKNIDGLPMNDEPNVKSALESGADLVTFSCDKLLGGPQGGVVAGRNALIRKLDKAPMMRALRVGKLTLAILSAACREYLDENSLLKSNPLFSMLNRSDKELNALASSFQNELTKAGVRCKVVDSFAQVGGGSLPNLKLKSFAVKIEFDQSSKSKDAKLAEQFYYKLLKSDHPIIGVLRKGNFILDVFTVFEENMEYICDSVSSSYASALGQTRGSAPTSIRL